MVRCSQQGLRGSGVAQARCQVSARFWRWVVAQPCGWGARSRPGARFKEGSAVCRCKFQGKFLRLRVFQQGSERSGAIQVQGSGKISGWHETGSGCQVRAVTEGSGLAKSAYANGDIT